MNCTDCGEKVPNGWSEDGLWVLGWRFFSGPSVTGKPLNYLWCPGCSRNRRPKKPDQLEGQDTLFT